jgi:hypothetical protein
MARKTKKQLPVRLRISANGAEVMVAGKWVPADGQVIDNCMTMLKSGLPILKDKEGKPVVF